MDSTRQALSSQSFLSHKKGFGCLVVLLCSGLLGCQSSGPQSAETDYTARPILKPILTALGLQLTQSGQNHSAKISTDGKYLLFVSKERLGHAHSQLYELDLLEQKERRITYQDGEITDPLLSSDGKTVYYTSTTDEMKEKPPLIYKNQHILPPAEIYSSDRFGNNIERLTNKEGFQGHTSWTVESNPRLIFSSLRGERLVVETLQPKTSISASMAASSQLSYTYPIFKNGVLAVVAKKIGADLSQIFIGKSGTSMSPLPLPEAHYQDLSWVPESDYILFSSNWKNPAFKSIFLYDAKKGCVAELLKASSNLTQPSLSLATKKMVFTSDEGGRLQIYLRDFSLADIECVDINKQSSAL